MSKRNFILLTVILVIIVGLVFLFLFTRQSTPAPGTGDTGTNFNSIFNPFGNSGTKGGNTAPGPTVTPSEPVIIPAENSKLQKVSSMPVAGFAVYQKERLKDPLNSKLTEFAPALRYAARETGNIYQTFADKLLEQKFSSTVIPKVYEALFGGNGQSVVMRYLKGDGKTIQTFGGSLPKEYLGTETTGNAEVKGTFLPDNIKDVSLSPDTKNIFYLFPSGTTSDTGIVGTIFNLSTNKKTQVFTSPFTEWTSFWPTSSTITLTTKPASSVPGYMYTLDSAGKNLNKVMGSVNGLTTEESPSGKLVLYSDNNLSLSLYHTDTKTSNLLGVKTLPEKCVWGKGSDVLYCAVPKTIDTGEYPDAWYQGLTSFKDQIWKIDIRTGNANMIADPFALSGGQDVDGIKLALDDGGNYLLFVNKKDSFLWELNLK